jgi:hypothetical protein
MPPLNRMHTKRLHWRAHCDLITRWGYNIFANLSASLKFSTDGRKHGLFLAFFSIVRVLFCQWEVFLDFGEGIGIALIFLGRCVLRKDEPRRAMPYAVEALQLY